MLTTKRVFGCTIDKYTINNVNLWKCGACAHCHHRSRDLTQIRPLETGILMCILQNTVSQWNRT